MIVACGSKIMPECGGRHRVKFSVKNSPHIHYVGADLRLHRVHFSLSYFGRD